MNSFIVCTTFYTMVTVASKHTNGFYIGKVNVEIQPQSVNAVLIYRYC